MTGSKVLNVGDILKNDRIDLERGLLNRDNSRSVHSGILAYTASDAAAVSERLNRVKRSAPRATDKHTVKRTVTVTRVNKTSIIGETVRLGDVFRVSRPAPYNPMDNWTAIARLDRPGGKIVVSRADYAVSNPEVF